MAKPPIDFWFSVGSIYTYLTVMRLPALSVQSGVSFRWRPFSVRALMIEMNNRPMSVPAKLDYMWRDMARRAAQRGLLYRERPPYPLPDFDLANRIALVGATEGWCQDYVRAAYLRWFTEHDPAGSEASNESSLRAIGQDPVRVVALAKQESTGRGYDAATDEARRLGLFGVPTFAIGREIFWGDDRLEDAIGWHREHG